MSSEKQNFKYQIETLLEENRKLKENQERLILLNHLLAELLKIHDLKDIYKFIAENLHKQISDSIIIFNSVNTANDYLQLECIEGLNSEFIKKTSKFRQKKNTRSIMNISTFSGLENWMNFQVKLLKY